MIKTLSLNAKQNFRPRPPWRQNDYRTNNRGNTSDEQTPKTSSAEQTVPKQVARDFTKRTRDISQVECFRCHKNGHYANDCKEVVQTAPKNEKRQN